MSTTAAAVPAPKRVLKVCELTRYLKRLVEDDRMLGELSVIGEVSNLSHSSAGHRYFSLKDDSSQLSCVLFRNQALEQGDELNALCQGVTVIVDGYMTVYEPRGTYQLFVERLHVQGQGAMQLRFERLRHKLQAEGLFAEERKRQLPAYPRLLALITSLDSRAHHDVLHRLRHQWPLTKVIEAGVSVQGEHAADEIVLALDLVNRLTKADVVLLVRGGGSPEELSCFNDERLARAIFASRIPVISGVGHDLDYTIVDFVADYRAATPLAAAAAAVPDGPSLRRRVARLQGEARAAVEASIRRRRQGLVEVGRALTRSSPTGRVRVRRQRVDEAADRLRQVGMRGLETRRRHLDALTRQLSALDPLAVLGRGYAVVTDIESGRVVTSIEQTRSGQMVRTRVRDGAFTSRVQESS